MKSLRFLVLAAALVLSYAVAAAAAPVNCTKKIESFDFVVDYSGSMMMKNTKLKKDKILVAKDIASMPTSRISSLMPAFTPFPRTAPSLPMVRGNAPRWTGLLIS